MRTNPWLLALAALALAACSNGDTGGTAFDPATADLDGDGVTAADGDCNDANASILPGGTETCNGLDDDCDGEVDNGVGDTWYGDADKDGYGNMDDTLVQCTQPSGYVSNGDDCRDTDARYNPGAAEVDCTDPNDYNCDGSVGYADADKDGFAACEDCNDAAANVNDDAPEVCDEVDNNCNRLVDEEATDASTFYADLDGDGFGNAAVFREECEAPDGYVDNADDCSDFDATVNPDADEVCDGLDTDCDGTTPADEVDGDGDGFFVCQGDCDDTTVKASPAGTEVCGDGLDNDCEGTADGSDAVNAVTYYEDDDGDGFGLTSSSLASCTQPSGYATDDGDCDDGDDAIFPGAIEVCDDADNNCDGVTDEPTAADASVWFEDDDGDGYGLTASTQRACAQPSGYVALNNDCDDTDDEVFPGATELCNSVDDNCNGQTDESTAADATTYFLDDDDDGWGLATSSQRNCTEPSGYTTQAGDCDDTADDIFPGQDEVCDDDDNDCDGATDEASAVDAATWYYDEDGDDFGLTSTTKRACDAPTDYVADSGDCDDDDEEINPEAEEICDEADNDCNGTVDDNATDADTFYADDDGDDYGDENDTTAACDQPTGYVEDDTDCYDLDKTVFPGSHATEDPGDGIDQDCDGNDFCTDLNCDGWPDLIVPGYYDGDYYAPQRVYYFDDAKDDYTSTNMDEWYSYGNWRPRAYDLDEDGYLDILEANYYDGDNTLAQQIRWGGPKGYPDEGTFSRNENRVTEPCVADFDQDGYLDWFSAEYYDGSSDHITDSGVKYGSRSGFSKTSYLRADHANDCDVADIDDDGYPDLLVSSHYDGNYSTDSYIYWGSSSGLSNGDRTSLPAVGNYKSVIADLDDDGDLDIVMANAWNGSSPVLNSYVYYNRSGFSTSNRDDLPTEGSNDVAVYDFDDDGYQDIVFNGYRNNGTGNGYGSTSTYVYWGSSTGYSTSNRTSLPSAGAHGACLGDFDGDGNMDIGLAQYYNGSTHNFDSRVYYGSSTGFSSTDRTDLDDGGPTYCTSADLNLDGYDEFILAGYYNGSTHNTPGYIYWGGSSGLSRSDFTTIPNHHTREIVPVGPGLPQDPR